MSPPPLRVPISLQLYSASDSCHSWMDQNLGMKHRGVNTELQDLNKALGKHSIVEEGKTFSMFHTS